MHFSSRKMLFTNLLCRIRPSLTGRHSITLLKSSLLSTSTTVSNRIATTPTFISPSDAVQQPRSAEQNEIIKFLDVRAPDEYNSSHIPNAINCHSIFTYIIPNSTQEGIEHLAKTFTDVFQSAGINEGDHVITYEDSLHTLYGASCRGLYLLKLLGHDKVSILNGGFNKWIQEGYPTTSNTTTVETRGNFKAKWSPQSLWSDKNDILKAINSDNTILLDVRDVEEWRGTSSSPHGADSVPRKGRLPGSVYILWKDFMEAGDDGLNYIKKPNEIRQLCASKGIRPSDNIIIYCFIGARASNAYIALKKAGFENVTNYFASWNEWSRDHKLPIDSQILPN